MGGKDWQLNVFENEEQAKDYVDKVKGNYTEARLGFEE